MKKQPIGETTSDTETAKRQKLEGKMSWILSKGLLITFFLLRRNVPSSYRTWSRFGNPR